MKRNFLSVIVPAYKEKRIKESLLRIQDSLDRLKLNYEIICVVDGKIDKTFEEAKKAESSKIKVIGYEKNHGKGYAVRFGMSKAKGNLIAFIDSGMEIDPEGIGLLLEHMNWYQSDVIVGSIRHSASRVYGYPFKRRIYSITYHLFTKTVFGLKITDSQRGLKIFKREVLEKVLPRLLIKQFAFDIEILAVAKRLGFKRIHDGPVVMDARKMRYSKVNSGTVLSMLLDTMAVFYRLNILRYYDNHNRRKWRFDPDLNFKVNVG